MSLEKDFDASMSNKESGLNNNYEIKVIEKLQTLISPSEAKNYKTVCEIFDEFLEKGLYDEETFNDTDAFLRKWIKQSEQSPNQVLDLVKHVFQIVIDNVEARNDDSLRSLIPDIWQDTSGENKHLRSWLVLATISSLTQISNLIIEGTWEDVLYELLKYTRTWDMDLVFKVTYLTSRTVKTLINVFCLDSSLCLIQTACSPTLCPSPYFRLQIIRLLFLFDPMRVKFEYGMKIVTAYVECMSSINPEQLFVIMGNDLLSMRHIMFYIYKKYYYTLKICFSDKVVEDLNQNQMGKEVRYVANSLKMIGMFAQIAKTRYKARECFLSMCLNVCVYLISLGHKYIFSKNVYNHKLIFSYTCCAIADITDGIISLYACINDKDNEPYIRSERMMFFNILVKKRNDLINDLEIPKEQFLHVKLCQREQSGNKFSNILFVKKAALLLTKLEMGTVCGDEIQQLYYDNFVEDDDSFTEGEDDSESSYTTDNSISLIYDTIRISKKN